MVRMSKKEASFDGLSMKESIVDYIPVNNEENFEGGVREQSGSEVTVMEIDYLRNECVKETEDNLNRRLIRNHKEVNKGCSRKNRSPMWAFFLPFRKVPCDDGAIWYYFTLFHCFDPIRLQVTTKGVVKYTKKTPPD